MVSFSMLRTRTFILSMDLFGFISPWSMRSFMTMLSSFSSMISRPIAVCANADAVLAAMLDRIVDDLRTIESCPAM